VISITATSELGIIDEPAANCQVFFFVIWKNTTE